MNCTIKRVHNKSETHLRSESSVQKEEKRCQRKENVVQAIGDRSRLHRSGHLWEIRHITSWMDCETSGNECDNNHTIPPCWSGFRTTRPSVWWVFSRPLVFWWCVFFYVHMGVHRWEYKWLRGSKHTHAQSLSLMYWAVINPRFDVTSGLNFHLLAFVPITEISSIPLSVHACVCVCVCVCGCVGAVVVLWSVWVWQRAVRKRTDSRLSEIKHIWRCHTSSSLFLMLIIHSGSPCERVNVASRVCRLLFPTLF